MTNISNEIIKRKRDKLLPDSNYLSVNRFFSPYANTIELDTSLGNLVALPIYSAFVAIDYAMRAVWATLRAVSNLLIIKPKSSAHAFYDFEIHVSLSIAIAVMAPIHILSYAIESLTRSITSWFSGNETTANLANQSFRVKFQAEKVLMHAETFLPSANFVKKDQFFTAYNNVSDFFIAAVSPLTSLMISISMAFYQVLKAVVTALDGIANLIICKPRHAKEAFQNTSVHMSLAISLAFMSPINAILGGLAFLSRMGTTWVTACTKSEETRSAPPAMAL